MLIILVTLFFANPLSANGPTPSFNCAAAKTLIEKSICASSVLAQFDRELSELYRQQLKQAAEEQRQRMRSEQQDWVKLRNQECHQGKVDCLEKSYQARLQLLRNHSTTTAMPSKRFTLKTLLELRAQLKLESTLQELTAQGGHLARWRCSQSKGFLCAECSGGGRTLLAGVTWPGAIRLLFYRSANGSDCRLGAFEISPFLSDAIAEQNEVLGKVPGVAELTASLKPAIQTLARKYCIDPNGSVIAGVDRVFQGPDGVLVVREDKDDWSFEVTGASLKDIENEDLALLLIGSAKFFKDSRYFEARNGSCPNGK